MAGERDDVAVGIAAVAGDVAGGVHLVGQAAHAVVGFMAGVAGNIAAGDGVAEAVVAGCAEQSLQAFGALGQVAAAVLHGVVQRDVVDADGWEQGADLAAERVVVVQGGACVGPAVGFGARAQVAERVVAQARDEAL